MTPDSNSTLRILPLGIGYAFSRTDYYCSMLILNGDRKILIDCPDPIHKILCERTRETGLSIDAGDIDEVIVTHLHGDHSNGLESLLFYRKFVAQTSNTHIYALPEVCDALWSQRLAVSMEGRVDPRLGAEKTFSSNDFYTLHPVDVSKSFRIGDLEFSIYRTIHSLPTFALVVSLNGRSFGYSCDTIYDPDLIRFLSPADLIFHECARDQQLHTPYDDLMALDPVIRQKIHILHLTDDFDRDASELPIVQPGKIYTV